jgi:2-phosphoglycerate kinase
MIIAVEIMHVFLWGRMDINHMIETDLIREQVNITMFTKLILQLKSDQISFTDLMI